MLSSAASARNKEPILQILRTIFEPNLQYKVLEIASGTGEHATYFAENLPNVTFQPSENNPRYIHSVVAYIDHCRLPNIRVPLFIDVSQPPDLWPLPEDFGPGKLDAIFNANMIHISSNAAIDGLFKAAGGLVKPGSGKLITYGPYAFDGVIKPQSNVDFNDYLKQSNQEWGLRDVAELEKKANQNDLKLVSIHPMPANNHTLIFSN